MASFTRNCGFVLITLALVGCSNLEEVQEFANESAKFASDTTLIDHYQSTFAREAPFLTTPAQKALASDNDARRQKQLTDVRRLNYGVASYMQTLARLAGDESFDVSKSLDGLAQSLGKHPELGINEQQVAAYSSLAKTIAKGLTAAAQQAAVRDMVTAADSDLQVLLSAMKDVLRYAQATSANEKSTVIGRYESEIPFYQRQNMWLVASLGTEAMIAKRQEYENVDGEYAAAQQALDRIKAGHARLREDADHLSAKEVRVAIDAMTKEIKAVRKQLDGLES
ncbi:hypothetical protein [Pseudomonas putida]|uniref:hypothetical protein n=1 Tax=Pseudomonas putida TaxID=303 RepID=UPI0023651AEE|nr:hypothetical protein [Pseudomonas putida]MDD2046007.1 hypothetical protein [Pseudomonas putida]